MDWDYGPGCLGTVMEISKPHVCWEAAHPICLSMRRWVGGGHQKCPCGLGCVIVTVIEKQKLAKQVVFHAACHSCYVTFFCLFPYCYLRYVISALELRRGVHVSVPTLTSTSICFGADLARRG